MLLLELKEILNRHGAYGYWIGPDNVPHQVRMFNHERWAFENIYQHLPVEKQNGIYAAAFAEGYVRIEHETPDTVDIEGVRKDIKRILPVLRPTLVQRDVNRVIVSAKENPNATSPKEERAFDMPRDRTKLNEFLNSL